MQWIAPSGNDSATTLEKNLRAAADQFCVNSGLEAQEYSSSIFRLISLHFAEVHFEKRPRALEKAGSSSIRGSRVDDSANYEAESLIYLSPEGRFSWLLTLPESKDIGAKLYSAMRDIEKHNTRLAGVLHKTCNFLTTAGHSASDFIRNVD